MNRLISWLYVKKLRFQTKILKNRRLIKWVTNHHLPLKWRFKVFTAAWQNQTCFVSSGTEIHENWNHQQIIALGKPVISLIIDDLRHDPKWWFGALHEITGTNPVPEEHRGRLTAMTTDWLKWYDTWSEINRLARDMKEE